MCLRLESPKHQPERRKKQLNQSMFFTAHYSNPRKNKMKKTRQKLAGVTEEEELLSDFFEVQEMRLSLCAVTFTSTCRTCEDSQNVIFAGGQPRRSRRVTLLACSKDQMSFAHSGLRDACIDVLASMSSTTLRGNGRQNPSRGVRMCFSV